jgi:hypothetical protein
MDERRFDVIAKSLGAAGSRRVALRTAIGITVAAGLARFGLGSTTANKKKPKLNEFGCVNVGKACRGKDALCCSGICQGKKPKKGKQDKSKCLAHNTGGCQAGEDWCVGVNVSCGTPNGLCFQTTGRASFCGAASLSCGCTKDEECEAVKGPGAACIVCPGGCGPTTVNTACVAAAD